MHIVDMRLRPPIASWTDKPQYKEDAAAYMPTRIGFPRAPSAVNRSIPLLLGEMDEAGITCGVIMGRKSRPPLGSIPNAEIAQFVSQHRGRFVAFVGVSVSDSVDESLGEIDRFISQPGFCGVSIEPCCAQEPMYCDDARIHPIFEKCQALRVPLSISLSTLLTTMGGTSYKYSSPLPLYNVAKAFPRLNIVISHGAWPWVRELLGIAYSYNNVWVSPDLYMLGVDTPGADEYVKAARFYLSDRTLFGTAYPTRPLVESVAAFHEWGLTTDLNRSILGENARRLMNL